RPQVDVDRGDACDHRELAADGVLAVFAAHAGNAVGDLHHGLSFRLVLANIIYPAGVLRRVKFQPEDASSLIRPKRSRRGLKRGRLPGPFSSWAMVGLRS